MPGGARLIVLLLGCLEPVLPAAPARAEAPIDRSRPVESPGQGVAHGRVVGACSGVVLVEPVDADGDALARVEARDGVWQVGTLPEVPARLRYGCDVDGDGRIPAAAVRSVALGSVPLTGGVLVLVP